jgi:hypothetical protein
MTTQLTNIDHELAGLRAKLRWDHIAEFTRQAIAARIAELEAKRKQVMEQGA